MNSLWHVQSDEGFGEWNMSMASRLTSSVLPTPVGALAKDVGDTGLRLEATPTRPLLWIKWRHGGSPPVVLTDEVLLQPVFQFLAVALLASLVWLAGILVQSSIHTGQMLYRQRGALGLQLVQLVLKLDLPALDGGQPLIVTAAALVGEELLPLSGQVVQLPTEVGLPLLVGRQGFGGGGLPMRESCSAVSLFSSPADLGPAAAHCS